MRVKPHGRAGSVQKVPRYVWGLPLVTVALLAPVYLAIPYGVGAAAIFSLVSVLSATTVLAAWWWRSTLYRRASWLLVGLVLMMSGVANILWFGFDLGSFDGDPLIANLLYLAGYVLLVVALWYYGRHVESSEGAVLDASMIVVAAAVLFWAVMVRPHLGEVDGDVARVVLNSAYPVACLVVLSFLLKLFFLSTERSTALVMMIGAVSVLLVGELLHAQAVALNRYAPGGPVDMFWFAVYGLIPAAAWHPSATCALSEQPTARRRPFLRLLVIGIASITVPAVILIFARADHELVRIGALASILLFMLMLVRMTFLLRYVQQQSDELERAIRLDPLTRVANRRGFEERLELEMARARRTNIPLTVAFLDLDHFKRYNDRHGHPAGDDLLCRVVERWRRVLRETDFIGRIGGEEFVVILPAMTPDTSTEVVQRLATAVPADQTCSVGVTAFRHGDSMRTLLHRADEALYEAKRQGRDRIVVH